MLWLDIVSSFWKHLYQTREFLVPFFSLQEIISLSNFSSIAWAFQILLERSWLFVRVTEWLLVKSGESDAPEERSMRKGGCLTVCWKRELQLTWPLKEVLTPGWSRDASLRPSPCGFLPARLLPYAVWTCLGLFIYRWLYRVSLSSKILLLSA